MNLWPTWEGEAQNQVALQLCGTRTRTDRKGHEYLSVNKLYDSRELVLRKRLPLGQVWGTCGLADVVAFRQPLSA